MRSGTGDQKHVSAGILLHWEIRCDLAVGIETVLFDRSYDANNGDGLLRIEPEMFSDSVIVWPESLREFLVNDGELRRFEVVLIREEAARDQWDLHCPKIVCACGTLIDLQLLPRRRIVPFHMDSSPSYCAG